MLIKDLELGLKNSQRRKRVFKKAFKIFEKDLKPFLEKYKQYPLTSLIDSLTSKYIKTREERYFLNHDLKILSELYLNDNSTLIEKLSFEYFENVFWQLKISKEVYVKHFGEIFKNYGIILLIEKFWGYYLRNQNKKEKDITKKILSFYLYQEEKDDEKINEIKSEINKIDRLELLTALFKLVYVVGKIATQIVNDYIETSLLLIPQISKRRIEKQKKKVFLRILKSIIINSDFYSKFNLNEKFIEEYIQEKYKNPLEDLKKEYIFDEKNNQEGRIFKKISWLLYNYSQKFPDILKSQGIELNNNYNIFVQNNSGLIWELTDYIFKKRIEGIRIKSLEELKKILEENKYSKDKNITSLLRRNLVYKAFEFSITSCYLFDPNIRKTNKVSKELLSIYKELNEPFILAKKYYENTISFLKKNESYEKKLFFIYENMTIMQSLLNPELLQNEIYFWFRCLGVLLLSFINGILEKETFSPEKSKDLDVFLFKAKILTKSGKIIHGYVKKDFLEWLNYCFKNKSKENRFFE